MSDQGTSLSRSMQYALDCLRDADPRYEGVGVVSTETGLVDRQAWVHWRTAYALQDRGLVVIEGVGEEASVRLLPGALTDE